MNSSVTAHTPKRQVPKQINKINCKSKEADATELDKQFAWKRKPWKIAVRMLR